MVDDAPGGFFKHFQTMQELTIPSIPPGLDFARDTFWHRYRARFTTPIRMGWKVKPAAKEWLEREEKAAKLYGTPFPPAPIFQRAVVSMPQPWTGMDERPGRVPRTGK